MFEIYRVYILIAWGPDSFFNVLNNPELYTVELSFHLAQRFSKKVYLKKKGRKLPLNSNESSFQIWLQRFFWFSESCCYMVILASFCQKSHPVKFCFLHKCKKWAQKANVFSFFLKVATNNFPDFMCVVRD